MKGQFRSLADDSIGSSWGYPMRKFVASLIFFWCLGSAAATAEDRSVAIWFDTDVWNQNMLLKDMNDNAEGKHLHFVAVQPGSQFNYKISYDNAIKPVQSYYGQLNAHAASVTCYDATGQMLFTFSREARSTEKGAANAASKEIIKRLLELEKLSAAAGDKPSPAR